MTRLGVTDGYTLLDQITQATKTGAGAARTFAQNRLDELVRTVVDVVSRLATAESDIDELESWRADLEAAWASYTPSWTNLTVGNGTVDARYNQQGSTVHFHVLLTFGSTTSISGLVTATVPVEMRDLSCGDTFKALGRDNTAGYFGLATSRSSTTAFQVVALTASASYVTIASLSSTVPFTWANTDRITISGTYEAA